MSQFKRLLLSFVILMSFISLEASAIRIFIHVQGDSNSEGLVAGECKWNQDLCAGLNTPHPWPSVMEEALRQAGIDVIVLNHAESGRQLVGRAPFAEAVNGVGQKDGRAALQSIVMTMMNQGGEQNENNVLIINLGTNDLQGEGVKAEDLRDRMLKHILTILTNPTLQYNLHARIAPAQQQAALDFLKQLSRLIAEEIATGANNENLTTLIHQNRELIRHLFDLIGWRIVIVPPVLVAGHPYGGFRSAELARQWPTIVNDVIDFLGRNPRLIAVNHAQDFAQPHVDEFGGSVHLNAEDHAAFGRHMAAFLRGILRVEHPTQQPHALEHHLKGMFGFGSVPGNL
jgi:lysophospholipase L1-like esterase